MTLHRHRLAAVVLGTVSMFIAFGGASPSPAALDRADRIGQPAGQGLPVGHGSPAGYWLRDRLGLSPGHLADVERGLPVAVVLPSANAHEVVVGGAIRVQASPERLVALLQDVERLESGRSFLATRRISSPPRPEDFDTLELPRGDLNALKRCRPGACDVKLGQRALDALRQIDWRRPDAAATVTTMARRAAYEYLEAYRRDGNRALAVYLDSDRPQDVAHEFAGMLTRTRLLPASVPSLVTYLLEYPTARLPPDSADFFYWSLADFGLKPVLRLNHVVVFTAGRADGLRAVVAVKQLYASHYFRAALELRLVLDDGNRPGAGSYIVVLNMARADGLTGLLGWAVKSKVRGGSRNTLKRVLDTLRALAEAPA